MRTLIAVPCMDYVHIRFAMSLATMLRIGETKLSAMSNASVYQARNALAAEAIDDGCDWILWLDSDMVFGADLMQRLVSDVDGGEHRDFVSALYFKRLLPTAPVIYDRVEYGKAHTIEEIPDGLFQIRGAGFGACMTSVTMMENMFNRYGPPFNPMDGLGEDMSFCTRAEEAGYTMYCDSSIQVGHVGSFVFTRSVYEKLG